MNRWTLLLAPALILTGPTIAARAAPDALPQPLLPKATPSGAVIELQDFVTLPRHDDGSAARVQFLCPAADNSSDLFVLDAVGIIYRVSADGAQVTPYLDLRTQNLGIISPTGEQGLVGLAFHPNFAGDPARPGYGRFYTAYSADRSSGTPDFLANDDASHHQVIREWTTADPYAATFNGSSREVLRVGKFAANHNGGVIRFNPNAQPGSSDYGKLYIGFGDGGDGNDPRGNAQNLSSPLGKILRIDPMATAGGAKYGIPADNPFLSQPSAGPLVWAYGLRNPQQFSWEVGGNQRMFIGDIGQNQVEEIELGVPGANYGWQIREGTFATGTGVNSEGGKNDYASYPLPSPDAAGLSYPIAEYDHSDDARDGGTQASGVAGGFLYRGAMAPQYHGDYVFTDFVQGRMFGIWGGGDLSTAMQVFSIGLRYHGVTYDSLSASPIGEGSRSDLRLGEDANGELYALLKGPGAIYRLVLPR
ncbi:PQQ-dependent sugar dehydrogenase [Rhizosaccharibacter radicis]|uniref:PQQ-dependent sugar dehydrogenase n=1 Tax=Rhizosaccharibacter radicis TaxID=2782605 RepID=A0ABT1VUX6_9PROT|nr:PQQ-dependent sugar dehydrogenase [Acetobacteraceae bacterium KSS12]